MPMALLAALPPHPQIEARPNLVSMELNAALGEAAPMRSVPAMAVEVTMACCLVGSYLPASERCGERGWWARQPWG